MMKVLLFKKIIIMTTVFAACGEKAKDGAPPPVDKVTTVAPSRGADVTLLNATIPLPDGGFSEIEARDFVNGNFTRDIVAPGQASGGDTVKEEANALTSGVFLFNPGFIWRIDPIQPVRITLSSRKGSKTIERIPPADNGKLAVSLGSFAGLYPPDFREVYELTLASHQGSPEPFSYGFSFTVARAESLVVHATVLQQNGSRNLRLGRSNPRLLLTKVEVEESCSDCTIEITELQLVSSRKEFIELPAVPDRTKHRITFPRRYSGLLIKRSSSNIEGLAEADSDKKSVNVFANIPSLLTQVAPWCARPSVSADLTCPMQRLGSPVKTFFGFINAVPFDANERTLGSAAGIASFRVAGSARMTVRRQGLVVESKVIAIDSGTVSPLDDPSLPAWALDDVRSAIFSGAPEYTLQN